MYCFHLDVNEITLTTVLRIDLVGGGGWGLSTEVEAFTMMRVIDGSAC